MHMFSKTWKVNCSSALPLMIKEIMVDEEMHTNGFDLHEDRKNMEGENKTSIEGGK